MKRSRIVSRLTSTWIIYPVTYILLINGVFIEMVTNVASKIDDNDMGVIMADIHYGLFLQVISKTLFIVDIQEQFTFH